MRIDLEPRARPLALASALAAARSRPWSLALLIGGLVVALLGKSPVEAFRVYFVAPLSRGLVAAGDRREGLARWS